MKGEIVNLNKEVFPEQFFEVGTLRRAYAPDRLIAVCPEGRQVVQNQLETRGDFLARARETFLR